MNVRKAWMAILIVLSLGLLMSVASAQTVSIADGSAYSGATTTVAITADDVTDLANFDITVTYNPAVVIVTGAANDMAFGSAINNLENAAAGWVRLASLNFGDGQTGDGILLSTLTLEAVGTAGQTSALTLTIDELKNSTGGDITATTDDGTFTINKLNMTVTATPTSVAVNTSTSVVFDVTSDGAAVAGATVTLSGAFDNVSTTGDDGTATIDVNATSTGTIYVTATEAEHEDAETTVTASDQAGPVISEILFNSAISPTVTAGANVNVSVTVSNSDGWENIDTVVVDMSAFGAGPAEELSLMANDTTWAVFNESIQVMKATAATATANASDKAGNWSGDSVSGVLTVNPAEPSKLAIFGTNSSAPSSGTITQTVVIQDEYDNNMTAASEPFSYVVTMSASGSATVDPGELTITREDATAKVVINDTICESIIFRAKNNTGLVELSEKTLTYYGVVNQLDVTLNKTAMNANAGDDAIEVTVQLQDSSGQDIESSGVAVVLSYGSVTGLFDGFGTGYTNDSGVATFVITSTTKSGSDYVEASASGKIGVSDTITVSPVVSPDESEMVPGSGNVMAGTDVLVNVTTNDYAGNPIADVTVTFNVTSGNGTLDGVAAGTPVTVVSDSDGIAEVTFAYTIAGDASVINATIDGVPVGIGNEPTLIIVPNVIDHLGIIPGTSIGLTNEPGDTKDITIQLLDAYGNNITTEGVAILVTTDNTALGNMTNDTTYYDDNLCLTTTDKGCATFTYQVNTSDADTADLLINATAYDDVTETATISTSGPEGIDLYFDENLPMVGDAVMAIAQLTNADGDPLAIEGKDIYFMVRNPDGNVVGYGTVATVGDGMAEFVITSAMAGVAGEYIVTAENATLGLTDTNTATFVGPAVELVLYANQTVLMSNQTVCLNATMEDANGCTTANLDDAGIMVAFFVDSTPIGEVALSDGVASTTYTQSTPGTVTIEAVYNETLQDGVDVEFTPEEVLTVDMIEVTPAGPLTMNMTETQTFTAVCKNGTTELTGITVTWVSSNMTVGTIDASGLFTAAANGTTTITATAQGVTSNEVVVTVGAAVGLIGDINGDCTVDYIDLAMLGASYGLSVGETGYNAAADLNDDDTVDYIDLAMLGAHYGESCGGST